MSQTNRCLLWPRFNEIGSKHFEIWGLNDVMRSHCHSVTFATWPDLGLYPYLHKPALIRLSYITFITILTDFMRCATQHKVSGIYISQTLILNLWSDRDLARDFKNQLKHIIGSVLSRAFVCRLARVAATIGFQVINWGRSTPLASSGCRNTPAAAGLTFLSKVYQKFNHGLIIIQSSVL